jgi:hypothetical protein
MLFDPPYVVHQLRIVAISFDQVWQLQYLLEPSKPNLARQRSRPWRVGLDRTASSKDLSKHGTARDRI